MRVLLILDGHTGQVIRRPTNGSEVDDVSDDIDVTASGSRLGREVVGEGMFVNEIEGGVLVKFGELSHASLTPESRESKMAIGIMAFRVVEDEEEAIILSQVLLRN